MAYTSAQGKRIDIDSVRLVNEDVISVGNMKVNARGDQLGPGGKVAKTRDQVMKEYYTLNTPVADDSVPQQAVADVVTPKRPAVHTPTPDAASGLDESDMGEPISVPVSVAPLEEVAQMTPAMRGAMAHSLLQAKPSTVTQTELLPLKKANGVQRF